LAARGVENLHVVIAGSINFTDATTVAPCDRYDLESVLSFDDHSDGLVDRIDPSTV